MIKPSQINEAVTFFGNVNHYHSRLLISVTNISIILISHYRKQICIFPRYALSNYTLLGETLTEKLKNESEILAVV